MKPNHQFSFLRNNAVSSDIAILTKLYLPILGREAVTLYLYLLSFVDNGQKQHLFSQILNHLDFGLNILEESFERLAAIKLVDLYQTDDHYLIQLHSTLTAEEFFSHNVYSRLLEKKIGEAAAETLRPENPSGEKLVKPFMQVFGMEAEQSRAVRKANDFDLEYFKQRMAQDNLRFANEKEDLLELFAIAEQKKWTWYETYVLARETAVSQVLSTKRMKQKLAQKPAEGQFSKQEQSIIQEAKRTSPMVFLAEIKKTRQAAITRTERKLLLDLAELGLLDEVINVILLLTFSKVDSANLNEKYALKVANDFSYQKVTTAEEAVLKIRERNQQTNNRPAQVSSASAKSNVPIWSNPDYKDDTTPEQQAKLEEKRRKLLEKIRKGSGGA
ncbi:DnaD domain protein [Streptococcus sanguinis]|uniref:DnaD domain protein n=1 Tax=Streptococcus sanguinis TaxID=1305 RepID=UPI0022837FFA|nr:DnaD domain protein [Streptococcus sanguinis]MCY7041051.1 DnaD domain protein [Streptococcus sanguinis]